MEFLKVPLPFPVTPAERALILEEIHDLVEAFGEDVESGFFAATVPESPRGRPSRIPTRSRHR